MRIITGKLKGRKLEVPANADVRPTSDRAKESIFNIVEARSTIKGAKVLDIFSGSGNLGFEAISRGALHVTMVDASRSAIEYVQKMAKKFGVDSEVTALCLNADEYLKKAKGPFDLIFADPPYDFPSIPEYPDIIMQNGWLTDSGWFILEHDVRHLFHDHPKCVFTKPYGRTIVSIFLNNSEDNEED